MKNLEKLISIESYNNKEQIVNFVVDQFRDNIKDYKIIKNKENDDKSILIGINTQLKDINPIVLSGHIDTATPDLEKFTNPFKLTKKDGKCYGLGTIDMKSFTAIIIDNINQLKQINRPVVIALTTDEETNMLCVKNIIEYFKKANIKPYFTIVGEPTSSELHLSSRGGYKYLIEVFGKACHSSNPSLGINSINILSRIITHIEDCQKNYSGLTSNCGVIGGGVMVNQVPDYAYAEFDVRTFGFSPDNFICDIKRKINQLESEYGEVKIKLTKQLEIPPLLSNNNVAIKQLASTLNIAIGDFNGGCEAGYYKNYSGEAVVFGVGDIKLAHKPNEYVEIKEYLKYSELLLNLIKLLDKKEKI